MRALDAQAAHQNIQGPHIRHVNTHVAAHGTSPHRDVPQFHDTRPDCDIRKRLVCEPNGAATSMTGRTRVRQ
jgi:hypothetical protein